MADPTWVPPNERPGWDPGAGPGRNDTPDSPTEQGVTNPDAAMTKPPSRPGKTNGQLVRKDGGVFQWNRDNARWSYLRKANNADQRSIPPAAVVLDPGYTGGWKPSSRGDAPHETGVTDPDSATGAGGSSTTQASTGGGGGGGTTEPGEPLTDLVGVPGDGELVKVGKQHWIFYKIPGRDSVMAWQIKGEGELERITGNGQIKPARSITAKQFRKRGVINFGFARELANTDQHPFWQWLPRYKEEAKVKPWLLDPEMFAVHAAAWLENGADPTLAQVQATDWWQTHTESERRMVELAASDPATFDKLAASTPAKVEEALIAAGFNFTDGNRDRVTGYYTRELMAGRMTVEDFEAEAERVSNPYKTGADPTAGYDALPEGAELVRHKGRTYVRYNGRDFALAKGFETAKYGAAAKRVDEVNVAQRAARDLIAQRVGPAQGRDAVKGLEEVRALVNEWLGPLLAGQWSEGQIAKEAQAIAESPTYRNELVARLRAMRASVYKGYDPELTYADISRAGKALFQQVWGQTVDEKDQLFQQVLQMNDMGQAQSLLRKEGLARGVQSVVEDAVGGMTRELGGQVIRSAV